MDRHAPLIIERVFHQPQERAGEGFERGVIRGGMLEHRRGDGEDHAVGNKPAPTEDVVDEQAMDAAVAVLEGVEEHEAVSDDRGMNDWMDIATLHPSVRGDEARH